MLLLKSRYSQDAYTLARDYKIPEEDIQEMLEELSQEVDNYLEAYALAHPAVDSLIKNTLKPKDDIPTIDDLKAAILCKLETLINKSILADRMAYTLKTLYEIEEKQRKKQKEDNEEKVDDSTTLAEIMNKLKQEENNEKTRDRI